MVKLKDPWKESYDKPRQHIQKQSHHFANKCQYSKSYGFSSSHVWMWEMDHKEGWETKNWCFRIVVLRVSWRVPRRSKQSVLKEINTEYSLEGLMLKLKLQYFGYQLRRANSLEKTLMLGKIEGKRRRGRQRIRWLNSIINSMGLTLVAKSLIRLRDWATTAWMKMGKPNC